jgi:hypothetical protein
MIAQLKIDRKYDEMSVDDKAAFDERVAARTEKS